MTRFVPRNMADSTFEGLFERTIFEDSLGFYGFSQ